MKKEKIKEILKETLKEKYIFRDFLIILLIAIIIFIPILSGHYATDTYNIEAIGYKANAMEYSFSDGRIIMGIVGVIADFLKPPIQVFVTTLTMLSIIVTCIIIIKLRKYILSLKCTTKKEKSNIIITLICFITIFNFMYIDCMYFVDCFTMALSILFYLIAAESFIKDEKNSTVLGFIYTFLGLISYQGSICFLISFIFLFAIVKCKNDKKDMMKIFIKSGVTILFSILLEYVLIKFIGNIRNTNRLNKKIDILSNLKYISYTIIDTLKNCRGLYPKNLFLIFFLIITIITIIANAKKRKDFLIKFICISIVTILSSYAMNIVTLQSYDTGRTKLTVGAAIGIMYMFIFIETDIFEKKNITSKLYIAILIAYIATTIINYEYLMIQHKIVNYLENKEMDEIEEYVKEYESNNNIKINTIVKVLYYNQYDKQYYKQIKNKSTYTGSVVRTTYFSANALNAHMKTNLKQILLTNKSKEAKEYLKIENNEKGYECIEDKLYISEYSY